MRVRMKDGLLLREVAGEHILIDASGEVDFSRMLLLSDTAATLVQALLQGPRTAEELADLLAEEYDVAAADALPDVVSLLKQMAGDGLAETEWPECDTS